MDNSNNSVSISVTSNETGRTSVFDDRSRVIIEVGDVEYSIDIKADGSLSIESWTDLLVDKDDYNMVVVRPDIRDTDDDDA